MPPQHSRPLRPSRSRTGLLGRVARDEAPDTGPHRPPPGQRGSGRVVVLLVLALALAALLAQLVGGDASRWRLDAPPAPSAALQQTPRRVVEREPPPVAQTLTQPESGLVNEEKAAQWAADARVKAAAALAKSAAAAAEAAARHAATTQPPPPKPPPRKAAKTSRPPEPALQTLSALSPELLQRHSNEIPGQPRRVVVSIYSDFTPGTNQATMLLHWVRAMKALRIRCLVAICQRDLKLETVQPLLEEAGGWCGAFNGSAVDACADNPKVGRWHYVQRYLALGFDSLTSDADIAWLRDPLPYLGALLAAHPAADVLSSTDANDGHYFTTRLDNGTRLYSTVATPGRAAGAEPTESDAAMAGASARRWDATFPSFALPATGVVHKPELVGVDERVDFETLVAQLAASRADLGLEQVDNCGAQFNTGIMLWRATPAAMALLNRSVVLMGAKTEVPTRLIDDQRPVNAAMRFRSRACAWDEAAEDDAPLPVAGQSLCGGDALLHAVWAGRACLGLLPVVQFANGYVYTAMRAHEQYGVRPFAFHATYSADKLMKLREEGVFRDPPARWLHGPAFAAPPDAPRARLRVLAYDVALPRELVFPALVNGALSPWSHVALVQHQIALFRAALAIAHVLGRAVQLPRLACSCECFYFVGRNCSIEGHRVRLPYVCPTDHWLRRGGANLHVPYVEPGFLDNPRRPAEAVASARRVRLCGGPGDPPCGDAPPADGVVMLPRGADQAAVLAALGDGDAADALELRLESAQGAWGGFGTDADAQAAEVRFAELIKDALSGWCCFHNSSNGVDFVTTRTDITQFQINYRWDWNGTNSSAVVPHGEGMEAGACAS